MSLALHTEGKCLVDCVNELLKRFFFNGTCFLFSMVQVIEFGELDKPTVRFLRQVLTKVLKETDSEDLAVIFGRSVYCLIDFKEGFHHLALKALKMQNSFLLYIS